jgi:hypothetical protein
MFGIYILYFVVGLKYLFYKSYYHIFLVHIRRNSFSVVFLVLQPRDSRVR